MECLETRQVLAATIAGAIYQDLDGNGLRDQGERALANWTVYLDLDNNGQLDAGDPTTVTNADGAYQFSGLAAGDYRVAEVVRSGWTPTNTAEGFVEIVLADNETQRIDFLNQGSGGTGVITGNVWRDLNDNGEKEPGDTGIANWTVFLDLNGDKILDPDEPFELTDGNGDYTFVGVLGGGSGDSISYEVQQVIPLGWEPAGGFDENYTAEVVEGETFVGPDFANRPVSISRVSGVVYNDLNGNGIRDGGEPGLGGWTVYADSNTNGALDPGEWSAVTAASGAYTLYGLEPGNVRIAEVEKPTFKPTSPTAGYRTVVAPADGTLSNVNFGNKQRTDAALSGVVYHDRDHNGSRDIGEEGLAGITIYLDLNDNSLLDAGEPSVVTSADLFYTPDIDEAGTWRFDHLPAGTYVVRQVVPAELSSTPELEREHRITLGPADEIEDVDSGDVYRPSEIHGIKFEDIDGNHVHDPGEPGLANVTIFLDLDRDNVLDAGEPITTTGNDGSYSFDNLATGAYVVRELIPSGYEQTYPQTIGGILWPSGVSNPSVGDVMPSSLQTSLAENETYTTSVSLTLPVTGALTNLVDVFLLFDDTGSFTSNSPIVRAAFPDIIAQLETQLPDINLGFGVGRLEEYGNFASEYATGRPFVLNQPIVAHDVTGFAASIQAALDRVAPGYGGDQPETVIEALYQMVTGTGFDGNNNGSLLDSGPAGLASTQVSPGSSGDVPPFSSFTPDAANQVMPASGALGGAGFRSGALPIIITATDTGFAYQPKGDTSIVGIDGLTLPSSRITSTSRGSTPYNSGAGIQETVTGLNALGALVIGLGTNASPSQAPRQGLESLASLTGAINRSVETIENGTADPIAPGDPFYFQIGTGAGLALNVADGIVAAVRNAVTAVNVNVTLRASDPRVEIVSTPEVINGLGAGEAATFDVTFTGDGRPHRFDLQFIREGTDVVLGSIPVVLGTPIIGDGYEFEDCDDGEISDDVNFGNQYTGVPGAAAVVGRHLFYNDSVFDGHDISANPSDDAAIATDKFPLFPGATATSANSTSFAYGINGLIVDISSTGNLAAIDINDFAFRTGTVNDTTAWEPLAVLPTVARRAGNGHNGSDRIVLIWPAGTVTNTWLEVVVQANSDTGLVEDDIFYFGNRIADTNGDGLTNGTDFQAVRSHPANFLDPAAVDDLFDLNKDGRVNAIDLAIVRDHATGIAAGLPMITPNSGSSQTLLLLETKTQTAPSNKKGTRHTDLSSGDQTDDAAHLEALLAVMAEVNEIESVRFEARPGKFAILVPLSDEPFPDLGLTF